MSAPAPIDVLVHTESHPAAEAPSAGGSPASRSPLQIVYMAVLENQDRFDEFRQHLATYSVSPLDDEESAEAAAVRARLNERAREWTNGAVEGRTRVQMLRWREIIVDQRFNIALSPWKVANWY